jgi:hypothetical protein
MDSEYVFLTRESSRAVPAPVVAGSLLMQLGFVGVSVAVIAVLLFVKGSAGLLPAVALVGIGVAFAAYAWRRSLKVLERAGEAVVDAAVAAPNTTPEKAEAAAASLMMTRVNRAIKYVAMPT